MTDERDLAALARTVIDSNRYMALGTADSHGTPWVSPVWYAAAAHREFLLGARREVPGVPGPRIRDPDLRPWTRDDVLPPARHRLYRAIASEHYVLAEQDRRVPVSV